MVCILDADKEGFLRSETSLIQTIGRSARHINAEVVLYADKVTASMQRAIDETDRRRTLQLAYNAEHGHHSRDDRQGDSPRNRGGDPGTAGGAPGGRPRRGDRGQRGIPGRPRGRDARSRREAGVRAGRGLAGSHPGDPLGDGTVVRLAPPPAPRHKVPAAGPRPRQGQAAAGKTSRPSTNIEQFEFHVIYPDELIHHQRRRHRVGGFHDRFLFDVQRDSEPKAPTRLANSIKWLAGCFCSLDWFPAAATRNRSYPLDRQSLAARAREPLSVPT